MEEPFTTKPPKLGDFLHYLADNGEFDVRTKCYKHKRIRPERDTGLATYEVAPDEKCGLRPKTSAGTKNQGHNFLRAITQTILRESKHLQLTMRPTYVQEHAAIEPARPQLRLKRSLRFRKGVILKLC